MYFIPMVRYGCPLTKTGGYFTIGGVRLLRPSDSIAALAQKFLPSALRNLVYGFAIEAFLIPQAF